MIAFVESLFIKSYSTGIFAMIEQMQIVFLISLISSWYPVTIMQFFRIMRFLLMEFNFIGLETVVFESYKNDDQETLRFENLGFKYNSGVVNIFENV